MKTTGDGLGENLPDGGPFGVGRMAYAVCAGRSTLWEMDDFKPPLPSDGETIAELRELYREAEARAARLRLLSVSGHEMAEAGPDTLNAVLERCAQRLAFFAGCRTARVLGPDKGGGIAIKSPGQDARVVGFLAIEGLDDLADIPDNEDREAIAIQLELMGTTIDRIERERERNQLLAALQEREKRLELTLERIFTAQEEERRRVSQELHDGVAQTATALVRLLESTEARAGRAVGASVSSAEVARGLVSELRRVIAGLRPTLLDDLGLIAALQSLAESLEAAEYEVVFDLKGGNARFSSLVETALFRVAQEAISNIFKHAGGPCEVSIQALFESDPVVLRISDAGCGPSSETRAADAGHSVGIEVMKERMAAIGGTLDWRTAEKRGVTVEARLPREMLP
ncbi:MAG: sensor histidine kinase [Pseudomonadota bacterium]|nr:sensor histidine kinase [Pseudomonadota bacterium]